MKRADELIKSWKPYVDYCAAHRFKMVLVDRASKSSSLTHLTYAVYEREIWEDYLRGFADTYLSPGFAAVTGVASDVVVLEVSATDATVEDTLRRIVVIVGEEPPETLRATSTNGDVQLYFKNNPERKIPNLVNVIPGVSVRGEGGYVVVPGPQDQEYPRFKFENDIEPADCDWLAKFLKRTPPREEWAKVKDEEPDAVPPMIWVVEDGVRRGFAAVSKEAALVLCDQLHIFIHQDTFKEAVVTDGRLYLHALTDAALTRELCRSATWMTETKKNGPARLDGPAPRTVSIIQTLARHPSDLPNARVIRQIAHTPFMMPSGEVFVGPGYEPSTKTLVAPHDIVPWLPREADLADPQAYAAACYARILSHFDEVPFASDDHRAAFVALLLTLISRPLLGDAPTPIFIVNANISGAGKTRLAQSAVVVATGSMPALTTLPFKEEEVAKRLLAEAISATDYIIFDNVRSVLGGASIESAITSGEITGRILGATEIRRGSLRLTWIATGNNCEVTSDMVARAIEIYLDAPDAEPRQVRFRVSEADWWDSYLPSYRSEILTDLLGIQLAHAAAGSPSLPRVMGSFGGWASRIAAAVWFASGCNPVDTQSRLREMSDSETEQLRGLLGAWPNGYQVTAADLMRLSDAGGFEGSPFADDHLASLRVAIEPFLTNGGRQRTLNGFSRCLANFVKRSVRLADGRTVRLTAIKDHSGTRTFAVEQVSAADPF